MQKNNSRAPVESRAAELETTDKGKEKSLWYDLPNHFDKLYKAVG